MRKTIAILAVALAPSLAAAQATPQATPVPKQVFGASQNLSNAIRVGDMVYASGQLGLSRQAPDTTIQGQTRLALENTKRALESAGTSMENVVKCTVFLTRVGDFQAMNGVYREFFPKDPPARSTVVVAALVAPAALVEIECMAAASK